MTEGEIMTQIGEAAIERKRCLDKMSCYEARLKTALHALQALLDPKKNPLNAENQRAAALPSDLREDAKGYVEACQRAEELTAFLRKHNAL